MIITTTVSFILPEEHEQEQDFRESHKDWIALESTGMRTYKKSVIQTKEQDDYCSFAERKEE